MMNLESILSFIFAPFIFLVYLIKKVEYKIKNKVELKKDNHEVDLLNKKIDTYKNKTQSLSSEECFSLLENRQGWIITKKESFFFAVNGANELILVNHIKDNHFHFPYLKGKKYRITYEIVRCQYIFPEQDYYDWPNMTYYQMLSEMDLFKKAFNQKLKLHKVINEIKVYKKTSEIEEVFKRLLLNKMNQ